MLRNYEIMYIVKPTLDEDTIDAVAKRVDDVIAGIGGEVEKTDKRGRKRLAYEVKDFKDTTLWELMLEIMRADNAKHRMILKFIRDHAKRDL